MLTSDEQILKLPELLKNTGKIRFIKEFFEQTGIQKSLFSNVKNQDKRDRAFHFTPKQIEIIIREYNINANWIFATSNEVFESSTKKKYQLSK